LIAEDITNVVDSTRQAVDNPNITSVIGSIGSVTSILTGNLRNIVDTFGYLGQSAIGFTLTNRLNNISQDSIYRSMATNRIRSSMIIPQSLINGLNLSNGNLSEQERKNIADRFANQSNGYTFALENKIKMTEVKALELELEADYMPFYFHDLRTNEIVSFNAFLSDMSDSFNVEWDSSTPYGRVEPVHQYKGTTRDINIGFFVVSTNPADFDVMWAKVNKLLTLIYPQYTKGREITSTNQSKFIQPFSQIPAASPVFRFRLGDVWKSNYSRFNIMRLFGITDSRTDIKATSQAAAPSPAPAPPPPPPPAPSGQPAAGGAIDQLTRDLNSLDENIALDPNSVVGPTESFPAAGPAWRGGRIGPVRVVFIGDSNVAINNSTSNASLVGSVQNLLCQTFPNIFSRNDTSKTEWIVRGVSSSGSDNWLNESEYTGRPRAPDLNGAGNGGQIAASRSNWTNYTSNADIVIISLGANDPGGYGSDASRDLIAQLKGLIPRDRPNGSQPIIIDLPRPLGDNYRENGRGPYVSRTNDPNYAPIVPPGQGYQRGHLTAAGAESYVQEARARAAIITPLQNVINSTSQRDSQRSVTNDVATQSATGQTDQAQTPTKASGQSAEELRSNIQSFFSNDDNPIMKTFEENGAGGGLAVICKSLNVDWNESTWSTDYSSSRLNARAPLWIKIQMNMTAIHDIIPGVGADGFMTAPVYSVGNAVNEINEFEDGDRARSDGRKNRILINIQKNLEPTER
jgi:hypothetical protein